MVTIIRKSRLCPTRGSIPASPALKRFSRPETLPPPTPSFLFDYCGRESHYEMKRFEYWTKNAEHNTTECSLSMRYEFLCSWREEFEIRLVLYFQQNMKKGVINTHTQKKIDYMFHQTISIRTTLATSHTASNQWSFNWNRHERYDSRLSWEIPCSSWCQL